jgi:hypothetical protein
MPEGAQSHERDRQDQGIAREAHRLGIRAGFRFHEFLNGDFLDMGKSAEITADCGAVSKFGIWMWFHVGNLAAERPANS